MRVLISELAEDAAAIAAAMTAQGHEVLAIPAITVAPAAEAAVNLTSAQAFLVASPVAARALAARVGVRTFPVFADSAVTADTLRRLGFKHVEAANDARDLANIVGNRLKPGTGALVHPCAAGTPSSLTPVLTNMGFAVRAVPLYTLARIDTAPPELRAALSTDAIDAAVFTTAEAARALVTVLQRSELSAKARSISALAANTTVAAPLRGLNPLTITIPEQADEAGLVAALATVEADRAKAVEAAALREQERLEAERAAALAAEEERRRQEAAAAAEQERKRLEAEREAAAAAEREQKRLEAERAAALAAEEERRRQEAAAAAEQERKRLETEREAAAAAEREQKRLEAERAAALAAEEEHRKREAAEQERKRLEAEREAAAVAQREQRRIEAERAAAVAAQEEQRKREAAEAAERERQRVEAERQAAALRWHKEHLESERVAAQAAEEEKRKRDAAEAAERERIRLEAEREAAAANQQERERLAQERAAAQAAAEKRRKQAAAEAAERERKRLEAVRAAAAEAQREQEQLEAKLAAAWAAEENARRAAEAARLERQERERLENERQKVEREALIAAQHERDRMEAARAAQRAALQAQHEREAAEAAERERQKIAANFADTLASRQAQKEQEAAEVARRERERQERMRQSVPAADVHARESSDDAPRVHEPSAREPLVQRIGRWLRQRKAPDQEPNNDAVGDPAPAGTMFHTPSSPTMITARITASTTANPEKPKQNDPPPSSTPELTVPQPPPSARLEPQPMSQPPIEPTVKIEPVSPVTPPNAMTQDHDTPVTESIAPPPAEGMADPAQPRQRGRAARLQAEDAADAVREPRWRSFADTHDETPRDAVEAPAPRRSMLTDVVLFVFLVLACAAAAYVLYPRLAFLHRDTALVATAAAPAASNEQPARPAAPQTIPQTQAVPPQAAPAEAPVAAASSMSDTSGDQARQMAALTARVATLEAALGNAARLDELNRRLTALEGRSAEAASVLALADRVSTLESASRSAIAVQTARVALVLAIAQWRDALAEGRPFALELESVKALAERDAEPLSGLDDTRFTPRAQAGIATTALLRERFDDTASSVMRAAAVPGGFNGFWGRSVERLMSIVTVRRVDGLVEGNTASAILARAGSYLKDGNLTAAVTEMEQLDGSAAAAAQPWLDEAHARVAAEQAVAAATNTALGAIAALPNAQPSTTQAPALRDAAPIP